MSAADGSTGSRCSQLQLGISVWKTRGTSSYSSRALLGMYKAVKNLSLRNDFLQKESEKKPNQSAQLLEWSLLACPHWFSQWKQSCQQADFNGDCKDLRITHDHIAFVMTMKPTIGSTDIT